MCYFIEIHIDVSDNEFVSLGMERKFCCDNFDYYWYYYLYVHIYIIVNRH